MSLASRYIPYKGTRKSVPRELQRRLVPSVIRAAHRFPVINYQFVGSELGAIIFRAGAIFSILVSAVSLIDICARFKAR